MSSAVNDLNQIQQMVRALIDQREQLKRENEQLKVELDLSQKTIDKLRDGNNPSKQNVGNGNGERMERLKRAIKQLDQYTKELDDCIRWIEKS
jgi:FtsZ-binding cell division protein ZapB